MVFDASLFTPKERAIFTLRALYMQAGYQPYRMARFEPYDLYAGHRAFLPQGAIATFTDLDGRLLALRPDVTLSLVNALTAPFDALQRFYYQESVYRADPHQRTTRETDQVGIECVGILGAMETMEVVRLALDTLACFGDAVLCLSHTGITRELLSRAHHPEEAEARLCARDHESLSREPTTTPLATLLTLPENLRDALPPLKPLCITARMQQAWEELAALSVPYPNVTLDVTLKGDPDYYDGLMMKGYVRCVPSAVLSGGRYDPLLQKMNKPAQGLGFAVYLDELFSQGGQPHA